MSHHKASAHQEFLCIKIISKQWTCLVSLWLCALDGSVSLEVILPASSSVWWRKRPTLSSSVIKELLLGGEMDHHLFCCAAKHSLLALQCPRHLLVEGWGDVYVTADNHCPSPQASTALQVWQRLLSSEKIYPLLFLPERTLKQYIHFNCFLRGY